MSKQRFIIIDGNALVHRAWHALPPTLTTKKGELINAVYGFALVFLKVLKDLKPTYIAVIFDKKAPTFRHKEFEEYKATRKKQPDELYQQIPRIKEIVRAFKVPIFEKEGYEADDLIGTLTRMNMQIFVNDDVDIENIIVTGDLDTLQLINNNTKVYTLKRGVTESVLYDQEKVKERYGLRPEQLIDFKALRGDPSDNIPGIKGIGEKIAIDLLKRFGSLERIYQNLESTNSQQLKAKNQIKKRIKDLLIKYKKEAFLSKRLATIIQDVPMKFNLDDCRVQKFDQDKVVNLFQELEFKSLLNKIPLSLTQFNSIQKVEADQRRYPRGFTPHFLKKSAGQAWKESYQIIDTREKFEKFLGDLRRQKAFALDTETTSLDPFQAKILGISFCWKDAQAYYLPISNFQFPISDVSNVLENPQIKKYGHNIKFDMMILAERGINLQGAEFDTMIASYLLNPGTRAHRLDNLVFTELGHQMISLKDLIVQSTSLRAPVAVSPKIAPSVVISHSRAIAAASSGRAPAPGLPRLSMEKIPLERLAHYSCEDVDYTFRLVDRLKSQLREKDLLDLFQKIEMPLVAVLVQMERNGVKIDVKLLKKLSKDVKYQISNIKYQIYKLANCEFNIDSPKQLKEILFEKLKISTQDIKKIKTGLSTAASELEKLRGRHPIIDLISEYRELAKLESTYLEALPRLVNPKTGRVHTSFNQTVTVTGRLSSSDPNLQNIPIRTELGQEIRKTFVVEQNYKLLSADYSQIELRVIASLANDQKMITAFQAGEDIHIQTASEIFGCALDQVTPQMRRQAKIINFGIIYGMGSYGLAQAAGISREQAKNFIEKYFKIHKDIKRYIEQTKNSARSLGYVKTLFGRRRWLPDIVSGVSQIKNAAERMAINFPIQGSAADIMKMAMIKISEEIRKQGSKEAIKMILQVHDELVFEVREDLIEKFTRIIKETMENVIKLKVPIKVDISVGDNWGEMERLEL